VRRESAKSRRVIRVAARNSRRTATLAAVALLVVAGSLLVSRGQAEGAGPDARPGPRAPASRSLGVAARPKGANQISLTSSDLPDDCMPNPVGPPAAPYQLGLVGTATNGALDTGSATVSDIDAKFCGIVTLTPGTPPCGATGTVDSPMDGQEFGALSVGLTLVPGMTPTIGFVANPGTITGGFTCTSSQNGLAVALDANVSGSTAPLFGVSCTIGPVTIPLTGAVTGPLTATTATLTSNAFSVPAIQPSSTCPAAVAANVDMIAGLPLSAGQASASLPVTASIYQPAP
jgi:hypothetical protein